MNIFKPHNLLIIFLYSISFALLLTGMKLFNTSYPNIEAVNTDTMFEGESIDEIQTNIADNIIRLHVIANSDSEQDQKLKLKVRDNIIKDIQNYVKEASTVKEAEKIINKNITNIQLTAKDTIKKSGYNYDVNVSLKDRYFPVKAYGDLVFPAGTYNALCVEIGTASGRNWWCVLFPSLCLIDDTKAVVPDSSKEKLKEKLTSAEYDALEYNAKIEYHSAIYDRIKSLSK